MTSKDACSGDMLELILAGPEHSSSLVSTERHRCGRINRGSYWRLALLGGARLLLLNRAPFPDLRRLAERTLCTESASRISPCTSCISRRRILVCPNGRTGRSDQYRRTGTFRL